MDLFKVEDLTFEAEHSKKIEHIDFSIAEKDIAVIFSNDASSSELLKTIVGIKKPVSGKIFYTDQEITSYTPKDIEEWRIKDVSYVSGTGSLFQELTVRGNIYMPLSLNKIRYNRENIEQILIDCEADELLKESPSDLTNLEIVKVKLARAMVTKPFVLALDNITYGLTTPEKNEVLALISHLNNVYNVTVIEATNDVLLERRGTKFIDVR